MAFGGNKGGGSLADINITPLVDVLLVLLIIFMVTAPMIHHGIKTDTPDISPNDPKQQPKEDAKDTLEIDQAGNIKLHGKIVTIEELQKQIKLDPKLQKSRELYINASVELDYGTVMKILGAVKQAGIQKLGVVVNSDDLALPPLPAEPAPQKPR